MSHRIHDPKFLRGRYRLNGHVRDVSGYGNHGTLVNTPTWDVFNKGLKQCICLDGNNQYVNLHDLTYLNAVSAFTICFWMNQDVIDQSDLIFVKGVAATWIRIHTNANGNMYFEVEGSGNRGHFDYSTLVSALHWHHVAIVFDGSQTGNADRLRVHIDGGNPATLGFDGTIPVVTADLSGEDATIGYTAASFDGRLYDFRILSCSLSRDEVGRVMRDPLMAR